MEISSLIAPISSLYISLDNSALERDFLSYFLLKRLPLSSKDVAYWNRVKIKANSFNLNSINDDIIRERVLAILSSKSYRSIDREIENSYIKIQLNVADGGFNVTQVVWFVLHNKKIDYLLKVEETIGNSLIIAWDSYIFTNCYCTNFWRVFYGIYLYFSNFGDIGNYKEI